MKHLTLLSFFACIVFSGCVTASKQVYLNQIQAIEEAYQNKEITKAEYLKLKMDSENAYRQRKATIAAGVLAGD